MFEYCHDECKHNWMGQSAILAYLCLGPELYVLWSQYRAHKLERRRVMACLSLLFLSTASRAVWFTLTWKRLYNNNQVMYYHDRITMLLFFTGFSLYLRTWGEVIYKSNQGNKGLAPKQLDQRLVLINGFLWLAVIIAAVVDSAMKPHDYMTDYGYGAIAITTMMLSFGSLHYGMALHKTMRVASGEKLVRLRHKILLTTVLCTSCFTVKAALFLYEALTGSDVPLGLDPWFVYTCPELAPAMFLFSSVAPSEKVGHEPRGLLALGCLASLWSGVVASFQRQPPSSVRSARAHISFKDLFGNQRSSEGIEHDGLSLAKMGPEMKG